MTINGWIQIAIYLRGAHGARRPARPLHGARVRGRTHVPVARASAGGERCSTAPPASTRRASSIGSPIRSRCCCSTRRASCWSTPSSDCSMCCRSTRRDMSAVPPDLAFNTAVSFTSNTNWQNYGGESTMSYLTQMMALTTQNFVSAATGIALVIALIRGFARASAQYASATSGSISRAARFTSCCPSHSSPRFSSSGRACRRTSVRTWMPPRSRAPSRR